MQNKSPISVFSFLEVVALSTRSSDNHDKFTIYLKKISISIIYEYSIAQLEIEALLRIVSS